MASKKTEDSNLDDDSVSIISNEIDEAEEKQEQILQYSFVDKNNIGIRRRSYETIEESSTLTDDIETAKDALDDLQPKSNYLDSISFKCPEDPPLKTKDKIKYSTFVLFGTVGIYLSYKFIPACINTLMLGGLFAFKFRRTLEILFTKDDENINFPSNTDYIPDHEAPLVQSIRNLYELNPHSMLYQGWMNQFLYNYHPETYKLSLTVSVYIKLKGSILIMSYPCSKVPKRSLYNERKPKLLFFKEYMYNLSRCNITLLPQDLLHKRKWSKKYPICIELNSESLIGVRRSLKSKQHIQDSDKWFCKDYVTPSLQAGIYYEKLLGNGVIEMKDDYDFKDENKQNDVTRVDGKNESKIAESVAGPSKYTEKSTDLNEQNEVGVWKTESDKIYLFARNSPEKELWFHRLNLASAYDMVDETINRKRRNAEKHNSLLQAYLVYLHQVYSLSTYPLVSKQRKNKKTMTPQVDEISDKLQYLWLNMLLGRICFDYLQNPKVLEIIADKLQKKLNAITLPKVMDVLVIRSLCFGKGEIPTIRKVSKPWIDHRGIWFELDIVYNGSFQASVDTKINLLKLKKEEVQQHKEEIIRAINESIQEDGGETSNDGFHTQETDNFAERPSENQNTLNDPPTLQGSLMSRFMEHFSTGFLQLKFVRKIFENVAKKELTLKVNVKQLVGTLIVNLPPPPSDRIWVAFKGCPQINFVAKPKFNDLDVPLMNVLSKGIHIILIKEIEKVIVFPNMVNCSIPMMKSDY